jgi:hypothetical protein
MPVLLCGSVNRDQVSQRFAAAGLGIARRLLPVPVTGAVLLVAAACGGGASESQRKAGNVGPDSAEQNTLRPSAAPTPTQGNPGPSAGPSARDSQAAQTLGSGDIAQPALGPAPSEAGKLGGAPFVLVKNWDFGTAGTVRGPSELGAEFEFHDQFNTIANGTHYGAVIAAPDAARAIPVPPSLGVPGNMQPVEDPARPNREWTGLALRAHVRPLTAAQTTVSVAKHDATSGSFMAKWSLPAGGAHLQRDLLWETRARIVTPRPGFWFALWTAGNQWNKGAEMDVLETYGAPHLGPGATSFHVNSVGGDDRIDYANWPGGLAAAGVPQSACNLEQWHVWTWVYQRDDTYKVLYDGHVAQQGTLHWTFGAGPEGPPIDLRFLFDFTWGNTDLPEVNLTLPVANLPITYELDYSRVYLR